MKSLSLLQKIVGIVVSIITIGGVIMGYGAMVQKRQQENLELKNVLDQVVSNQRTLIKSDSLDRAWRQDMSDKVSDIQKDIKINRKSIECIGREMPNSDAIFREFYEIKSKIEATYEINTKAMLFDQIKKNDSRIEIP